MTKRYLGIWHTTHKGMELIIPLTHYDGYPYIETTLLDDTQKRITTFQLDIQANTAWREVVELLEPLRLENKSWFIANPELIQGILQAKTYGELISVLETSIPPLFPLDMTKLSNTQKELVRLIRDEHANDTYGISNMLCCSTSMVNLWMKLFGVVFKGKEKKTKTEKPKNKGYSEKIMAVWNDHKDWSLRKIAKEVGCCKTVVAKWLQREKKGGEG